MKCSYAPLMILMFFLMIPLDAYGATQSPQASMVQAVHRNGQTFVTWQETQILIPADTLSGKEFYGIKDTLKLTTSYRIYRSDAPITKIDGLVPMATVSSLSGWNQNAYGIETYLSDRPIHRYVLGDNSGELPNGTGVYVHNPDWYGNAYYAVTAVTNGIENKSLNSTNATAVPLYETVGTGKPVLQRIETPETFLNAVKPTLYYYTKWEAPPNSNIEGKAFDCLVGIPSKAVVPAPVGIHLHCWGGSQESGYTWWNDAEDGAILLSTNQDPYDWWTGYQEYLTTPLRPSTPDSWKNGVVHPYTTNRIFSFYDWLRTESGWSVDPYRTFMAGSSMGGSGSIMTGIRNSGKIAWVRSCVGVHSPIQTTTMQSAYAKNWGNPEYGVLFENGTPVWNYYDDVWYLRQYPGQETPFITFSNAKNDPLIDWPQAVGFYQTLQDTKRPHLFVWGQDAHSQMAKMPLNNSEQTMPLDIRINQSLPAFTNCSLDDNPGNGMASDGDLTGQINGYLYWQTEDVVDTPSEWQMTVGLAEAAPQSTCTVDLTPRRLQEFKIAAGWPVMWKNTDLSSGKVLDSGVAYADGNGLVTLPDLTVAKTKNRIVITK